MQKSGIHGMFATSSKKREKGIRIEYPTNVDGTIPTFVVGYKSTAANVKYAKIAEIETKPHRRAIDLGSISKEKVNELEASILVHGLLISHENIQDANGKEMKTSQEIINLLTELPELRMDINMRASDAAAFQDEETELDAKN